MNDLISRQAAIDALWKTLYEYEDKTEKQFIESDELDVEDWVQHRIFVQNMNDIDRQTILDLPSVNQWIPCSERLPEEDKDVLVWYEYFRYGDYNCLYQTYGIGYCSIVDSKVIWGGDVSGHRARAIAWMPLPEPWKGE